mmetsp:Transcript_57093/g.170155  ORF Transcript_57093/g.170155 Transcript_57093/m.170155 type:complete len:475 (-) Transcript_57093:451-1875(-)
MSPSSRRDSDRPLAARIRPADPSHPSIGASPSGSPRPIPATAARKILAASTSSPSAFSADPFLRKTRAIRGSNSATEGWSGPSFDRRSRSASVRARTCSAESALAAAAEAAVWSRDPPEVARGGVPSPSVPLPSTSRRMSANRRGGVTSAPSGLTTFIWPRRSSSWPSSPSPRARPLPSLASTSPTPGRSHTSTPSLKRVGEGASIVVELAGFVNVDLGGVKSADARGAPSTSGDFDAASASDGATARSMVISLMGMTPRSPSILMDPLFLLASPAPSPPSSSPPAPSRKSSVTSTSASIADDRFKRLGRAANQPAAPTPPVPPLPSEALRSSAMSSVELSSSSPESPYSSSSASSGITSPLCPRPFPLDGLDLAAPPPPATLSLEGLGISSPSGKLIWDTVSSQAWWYDSRFPRSRFAPRPLEVGTRSTHSCSAVPRRVLSWDDARLLSSSAVAVMSGPPRRCFRRPRPLLLP